MILSTAIDGFIFDFSLEHLASTAHRVYLPALRHLQRYCGDISLDQLTTQQLKRFMYYLQHEYIPKRLPSSTRHNTPLCASSVDNHWICLRSFCAWCVENGMMHHDPALDLPRPKHTLPDVIPYSKSEVQRLMKSAQYTKAMRNGKQIAIRRSQAKRNLAIIFVLLDTGVRLGGLSRLTIGDIHLDTGEIYVAPYGTGRKTKSRSVPIGKRTRLAIWHYLSTLDIDPGQSFLGLEAKSIRQIIQAIGKTARVPNAIPHRFRHTFGRSFGRLVNAL